MDFAKPQLEDSGLQASLSDLCCSASQHVIELRLRRSQSTRRSTASLRDRLVVSVSQLRIETFHDRCRVAVGLTVPWVLCLGHKLGVITQSHSQTVHHTLNTADVIVGLRVLAAAQLGDLLHNLSMALTSDGVFVCNLLIKSVIEPFSSRAELGNCGKRDASWERAVWNFTINFVDISFS